MQNAGLLVLLEYVSFFLFSFQCTTEISDVADYSGDYEFPILIQESCVMITDIRGTGRHLPANVYAYNLFDFYTFHVSSRGKRNSLICQSVSVIPTIKESVRDFRG